MIIYRIARMSWFCAKKTFDLVESIVRIFDAPDVENRDLHILRLVDAHFDNPNVSARDWSKLKQAYSEAVNRIATRLNNNKNAENIDNNHILP